MLSHALVYFSFGVKLYSQINIIQLHSHKLIFNCCYLHSLGQCFGFITTTEHQSSHTIGPLGITISCWSPSMVTCYRIPKPVGVQCLSGSAWERTKLRIVVPLLPSVENKIVCYIIPLSESLWMDSMYHLPP